MTGLRTASVLFFLLVAPACDETTSAPSDSSLADQATAKEGGVPGDKSLHADKKALTDSAAVADKVPPQDKGAPSDKSLSLDQAKPDSKPEADKGPGADSGPCQKSGQQCGKGFGSCCSGLKCCSGMPIPPGKSICYVSCPMSDRNLKYGVRPLSSEEILERLSNLPISSWTYNNEPPGVRHIGPMAQDFKAAFGVGADDRFISPVDADGVALAALQALHRQLNQLRCELKSLRSENRDLRREVQGLRTEQRKKTKQN